MTLPDAAIRVIEANRRRHVFVAWGVIIYDLAWRELSRARLGNITCGAINDDAIWFGTSDSGVWRLPLNTVGDATDDLLLAYHSGSSTPIQSLAVQCIAAVDGHLLVGTDLGADFIVDAGTVYSYSDANGVDACAINSTKIAYGPGGGNLHVLNHPTADWDSGDATVLSTGSSPAILSNTVQCLAYGTDLFIGTPIGISAYDGTNVTDHTASAIGTVVDVKAVHPDSTATDTAGRFAYATSDGAAGGRFGIYDMTGASNDDTVSGDALSAWMADDVSFGVHDDQVEEYALVLAQSPPEDARDVKRDWSFYAELIDVLDGVQAGSASLEVNGLDVTETITAITNGYKIEFTPAAASGYQERVVVKLSATDTNSNPIEREWSFITEEAPTASVSDSAIPNVTCYRDIGLSAEEADELIGSVRVIWLEDIVSPLIVDEAQAEAVGKIAIDERTYHKRVRTIRVKLIDANNDDVRDLKRGQIITIDCPALSMTAKKCELVAKKRSSAEKVAGQYDLVVAYYEAVS